MNGTSKTELSINAIQQRRGRSKDRYVDCQVAVYGPHGDAPLFRVGGRWDTKERRYDGQAEIECSIRLAESQLPAWKEFSQWLADYVAIQKLIRSGECTPDEALASVLGERVAWFTALWFGGRRSGKTFFACVSAALLAVAVSGASIGAVVPTDKKRDEMREILERFCFPAEWRAWRDGEIRLVNGSVIKLQTGAVTDLKAMGALHMAILNEAQEQKESNFLDMQGNVVDTAGLCILAQNPPRSNRGLWSQALYNKIKRGETPHARATMFDASLNPYKSQKALMALTSLMDERTAKREVLGDMGVPVGDVALHRWSDSAHVITWIPTTWLDVTQEITGQIFGRPSARIGGLDWDKGAGCCYAVGRIFRPHNAPTYAYTLVLEYGHRCKGLPEAKFAKHLTGLEDKYGYPLIVPASMVWVGDASSRTQSTYRHHDEGDPPSWSRMQREGWWIEYPDATARRNPRRADRFSLINQYVLPAQPVTNVPRVVFVADTAQEIIADARALPRKGLEADRFSPHAHLTDAWTYLCYRLWSQEYAEELNDGIPESVKQARRRDRFS